MPFNCPIDFSLLCDECRYNTDDKCWWFTPARLLKEILTVEERLEAVPLPQPEWEANQWDAVTQLKSEVVGWRQKHDETLLELDKLRKPKRKSKYD